MSAEETTPRGDQPKAPAMPAVPDRVTEPAATGRLGGLRGRGREPGGATAQDSVLPASWGLGKKRKTLAPPSNVLWEDSGPSFAR